MKRVLIIPILLFGLGRAADAPEKDYCRELEGLTSSLIASLSVPKDKPFSLSTRSEDDRYLIKLDEFWGLLTECVRERHNRQFKINIVDGALGQMAMNFYLEADRAGHEDLELGLSKLDSLIIGAELTLKRRPFSLHLKLRVTDLGARNIFTSKYFEVSKVKGHPGIDLEIFDNLSHARDIDRAIYNHRVIEEVNTNLFKANPVYASSKNNFSFKRDWPYGNPDQVTAIKNILRRVFGFTFSQAAADVIKLTGDGALVFVKAGQETVIPDLVDVMDMVDEELEWDTDAFMAETVPAVESGGKVTRPAVYEKITFEKPKADVKNIPVKEPRMTVGEKIEYTIEKTFAGAYGRDGAKPDFKYLKKVFRGKKKNIMKGNVKVDPILGREVVRYYWDTPQSYLSSLKSMVEKSDYRFDVDMEVMKLYQDHKIPSRYWAVVYQNWDTRNYKGNVVYRDDGFLFINFDFDDSGQLSDFQIFYRLWFYNYKYDKPEIGYKRWQLIEDDIKGAFSLLEDSKIVFGRKEGKKFINDDSQRGLSGIDKGLADRMRKDLVNAIRRSGL
ncbi:hypothetical protein ACFL5V_09075 [Fibrobacterota bacterium]